MFETQIYEPNLVSPLSTFLALNGAQEDCKERSQRKFLEGVNNRIWKGWDRVHSSVLIETPFTIQTRNHCTLTHSSSLTSKIAYYSVLLKFREVTKAIQYTISSISVTRTKFTVNSALVYVSLKRKKCACFNNKIEWMKNGWIRAKSPRAWVVCRKCEMARRTSHLYACSLATRDCGGLNSVGGETKKEENNLQT